MGLFDVGRQVEELVVPYQLDSGPEPRRGSLPLDADEIPRPLRPLPRRLVKMPVDGDETAGLVGDVRPGLDRGQRVLDGGIRR